MKIGRDAAMAILQTWQQDRALLLCDCRFELLSASFSARMVAASDFELHLKGDDKWAELLLPLRQDFEFGYDDMRDFPNLDETFERGLVIFFPYGDDPARADKIVLAEIRE